ncbi:hypothetical protein HaLaN_31832, partial [Haematococcus lacustris]
MQHQWQYRLQQPQLSPHHSPAQAETPGPGGEVSPQGMARLAAVQTCSDDGAGEGGCWGGASSSEADTDELLASIPVATQREEYSVVGSLQARLDAMFEEFKQQVCSSNQR